MPRHARLVDVDGVDDVVDRALATAKHLHDAAASGVGESLEDVQMHARTYVYQCICFVKRRPGPAGRPIVGEIDLRPGGRWRFVNRHPKGEAAFHGEYREITPPSRLVFTEIFEEFPDSVSVVTTELAEEDGKTRMTATVRYPSKDVRDMVMASGMSTGAGISYDRLDDLVAELQRA
jgi:uncharacterized protein YndB with AHSA1/START domain